LTGVHERCFFRCCLNIFQHKPDTVMVFDNAQNQILIKTVVRHLRVCESILFITGAGISADSGLPTYRGMGGLYNDRLTEDGIPVEMALAGQTLRQQPEVTWKYLARIEQGCRKAHCNKAHQIIAEMEKVFRRVWVLTQNIDGFHQAAGSEKVIDIHGNMHTLYCPDCNWRTVVRDYSGLIIPPRCPECESIIRPDVVFFGEMLPFAKVSLLHDELARGFDVYFSIGTTSVFPYIQQPIIEAKSLKKLTVEINPESSEVSSLVDIRITAGATEALEAIWKEYREQR